MQRHVRSADPFVPASTLPSRRALLIGAVCAIASPFARAQQRRSEDWLDLYNTHTGEGLKIGFRDAQGRFITSALETLDLLLGDHRSGEHRPMDPQLYVLLADLAAAADVEPHYDVISGYRSSATNEKLRTNGGGQAKNSQHIQGKAIDVRLKGVTIERLRDLAVGLQRGGVGYYRRSEFVHVDTARVRYWEE